MVRHLYTIERQSIYQTTREMVATEDYININNINIDNQNKVGTKITNNKNTVIVITFIGTLVLESIKEFQTRLQQIVNEKGLSCKYKYNNKLYLCLAQPRDNEGVFKQCGVIWHQYSMPQLYRDTEIVELKSDPDTDWNFADKKWQDLWYEKVEWLLMRRKPVHVAFFLGFVLTYTQFQYEKDPSCYDYRSSYEFISCCRGIECSGTVNNLTSHAFYKYVKPALEGKPQYGILDNTYSMWNGSQLTRAYYAYIIPFWDKYFTKKGESDA